MEYLLDQELYGKCLLEIQKLPQANSLLRENIDLWLDITYKNDPTRILWHIKRLNGFGGSEIGHLVADDFDEYDQYGSPRETVAAKLMLRMPDGPSGDTARGTYMEDMIRDIFRAETNARPLDDVMDLMSSYRSEDHPWLVGNTDDYLEIGGKKFVVDYKCPRPGFEDKYDKYGVKFDYVAQLHHYALIIKDLGHPVDGLILCSFDMVNWKNDIRIVDINPKMYEAILRRGDEAWFDYVMAGELPPFKEYAKGVDIKDSLVPEDKQQHVANLLSELSGLMPLANVAYSRAAEIKEEVTDILNTVYLGAPKLVSGLMDISVKPTIDVEKIEELALSLNLNFDDYRTIDKPDYEAAWKALEVELAKQNMDMSKYISKEVDFDALAQALLSMNEPEHRFKKESFTIALTKSKKPILKDKVDQVKAIAKVNIAQHLSAINFIEAEIPAIPVVDDKEPAKTKKADKVHAVDPLAAKKVGQESLPVEAVKPEVGIKPVEVVAETAKSAEQVKPHTPESEIEEKKTVRMRF